MISADTLFHFTSSPENLGNILQNEFCPHFSLETVQLVGRVDKMAFPMVCFCDIPLSQIKNHINTYGSYGIGMSMEWATRNALNPVIYLGPDSDLSRTIGKTVGEALRAVKSGQTLTTEYEAMGILRFIKPYEGEFVHNGRVIEKVRFYDEKEWRFVPKVNARYEKQGFGLTEDEYKSDLKTRLEDSFRKEAKLKFEPNDVRYLIIRDDKEIRLLVEALKLIKSKYDPATIEILISRIMTCDQIEHDV